MSTYAERRAQWQMLRTLQATNAEHSANTAQLRRELEIERLRALYATPTRKRGRKWTTAQRKRASLNADRERLSRHAKAWWRMIKSDPALYEAVRQQASERAKRGWTPERRAQWAERMRQWHFARAVADTRPPRAVAMRQKGARVRDIAVRLGVSLATVERWLKKAREAKL